MNLKLWLSAGLLPKFAKHAKPTLAINLTELKPPTRVIFRVELQVLSVPSDWIIDCDNKVSHVAANGLLSVLKKYPGTVGERHRMVARKPTKHLLEKVVGELSFSWPAMKF